MTSQPSMAASALLLMTLISPTSALAQAAAPKQPAAPAQPAGQPDASMEEIITEMVTTADAAARITNMQAPYSGQLSRESGELITWMMYLASMRSADKKTYRALLDQMEARADKQVGASPSDSKGSTSIALKGTTAEILGFAVETGALASDVSGSKLTFRGRPTGIVRALQGQGLLDMYRDYENSGAFRAASKWSFGVTFDTSRGPTPGSVTANGNQLSEWSIQYEIHNDRRPQSPTYHGLFVAIAQNRGPGYDAARTTLVKGLDGWPDYQRWRTAAVARVEKDVETQWQRDHDVTAANERFKEALEAELPKLKSLTNVPDAVTSAMDEYVNQLGPIVGDISNVYDFASKGSLATIDWTTARDSDVPDLYAVTGVFETAFGLKRQQNFTANAVASFYRSTPAGTGHQFKDVALTGQYDRALGTLKHTALFLTLAARYQYIPNDIAVSARSAAMTMGAVAASPSTNAASATPSATPNATASASAAPAIAPKGHLAMLQAKLTIPVKGSGVKIPLSITVANRTELIKEHDIRANVGITLDADALMALAFGK